MSDPEQLNLADYIHDLDEERRKRRPKSSERRTYIVFATDPEKAGEPDYKLTFATEARTEAEAQRKVRKVVDEQRRVTAYLASGKYAPELPEARWVA
jgi:rubrerythrin